MRAGGRSCSVRMVDKQFDVFGDPIDVTVGGIVVEPKPSIFPPTLEGPATSAPATITPFAEMNAVFFAPLEQGDLIAAVFLGFALLLGPDFLLAPAGLVSDKGIRPGYALESVVGRLIDPDAQWLRDRNEELAATAPLLVRVPIGVLFVLAGLLTNRLLLIALEDSGFVISTAICACIGSGLLEIIREPLPTREERDLQASLSYEFLDFSNERMQMGGRCHESDIVRAFRSYYPRYRKRDMTRSADGVSLADDTIADLARAWNVRMGRPAERTSSGFYKGVSLKEIRAAAPGDAAPVDG